MKHLAWIVALTVAGRAEAQTAAAAQAAQEEPREGEKLSPPSAAKEGEEKEEGATPHYFTAYTHHIEKGELEVMVMTDYTSPSKRRRDGDGQKEYISQMPMIEYAPTSQLSFEFMLEYFDEIGGGEEKFTGFRLEARYRLFEQEVPLNPTLYLEYEDLDPETRFKMEVSGWVRPPYDENGEEENREKILESRLILSQDFGPWNVAFNWLNESDLQGGVTAFGYMLGVSHSLVAAGERAHHHEGPADGEPWVRPMALALELVGALGDTEEFGVAFSRQEHYLQPSIALHLGGTMVGLGFAFGLSEASDDLVRLSVGWHF